MADQAAAAVLPYPPPLIPTLPDDISLQILARVPRSHHPVLSVVSKSWRSVVNSVELFRTRSLLRTVQFSLYLILRVDFSFFCYSVQINQYLKRPFVRLPPILQHLVGYSILALGDKIYVIGGSINDVPSNSMRIFDCRFNKWETGPEMRVAREFPAAGAWDGKIYVIGGCNVDTWPGSINWAEVFDPETGMWSAIPSAIGLRDKWMNASAVIGSKFYAVTDRGGVVYDMSCGKWKNMPQRLDFDWRGRAAVVDNVLYCYDSLGMIRGYDVEEEMWKELRGVEDWLPKFLCSSAMVNLDGKLCIVWERKVNRKDVDIMCAVIDIKREVDGGLNGTMLSLNVILVVPNGGYISHCLAVEF